MTRMYDVRTCRVCGCTDFAACQTDEGPCYWVEEDLCSACVDRGGMKESMKLSVMKSRNDLLLEHTYDVSFVHQNKEFTVNANSPMVALWWAMVALGKDDPEADRSKVFQLKKGEELTLRIRMTA